MRILDYFTISLSNLGRQKLRTILTIGSIVIGSTLISLVYAVIPGIENFLDLQLNTLTSPRLIQIYPSEGRPGQEIFGSIGSGPEEYKEGDTSGFEAFNERFTEEDLDQVRAIDGVKKVYNPPYPTVKYVSLEENEKRLKPGFVFFYPKFVLENLDLVSGDYYGDDDTAKAILAFEFVESFGFENPEDIIGKKLFLRVERTVVSEDQPLELDQSFPQGQDGTFLHDPNTLPQDLESISMTNTEVETKDFEVEVVGVSEKTILSSVIFVSYPIADEMATYAQSGVGDSSFDFGQYESWVEIEDASQAKAIDTKIEELGFSGMTFEESKNVLNDIFGILTAIFSSFGILAMAVSSLGILNTLIMAVYERTREIGVMKAIGATQRSIAILFTIEAALIGFLGGVIGVLFGYGLSEVLNYIGHKTVLSSFETLDISNISPLLLLALGISTVVATLAGIYPAIRASRLNPIHALRYE